MKGGGFLDNLSEYQIPKKACILQSPLINCIVLEYVVWKSPLLTTGF